MGRINHHTAIVVSDLERSMAFYRDGIGMEVTFSGKFDGPWEQLFGAPNSLDSYFLGDASSPSAGTIELVQFPGGREPLPAPEPGPVRIGFLCVSLYCDVDETLSRLADLGYPDHQRIELETPQGTLVMATVRDPDGGLVELIDAGVGSAVTG